MSVNYPYDWGEGDYSVHIGPNGTEDDAEWFGVWVTDKSTDVITLIGSVKFAQPEEGELGIQARSSDFLLGSFIQVYGAGKIKPIDIPVFDVSLGKPYLSGAGDPDQITVLYSLTHDVIPNGNVSYDAETESVNIRVGGTTVQAPFSETTRRIDDE